MPDEETVASLARRQLAVKIAAAYLRRNQLDASQIASLILTVHQTIGHLGEVPEEATERTPAVTVSPSGITQEQLADQLAALQSTLEAKITKTVNHYSDTSSTTP